MKCRLRLLCTLLQLALTSAVGERETGSNVTEWNDHEIIEVTTATPNLATPIKVRGSNSAKRQKLIRALQPGILNTIVTENTENGSSSNEWDLPNPDAGNASIQGFATDISVNKGETITFKIDTDASEYTVKIYRLGYYQGNGARFIADGNIVAALPQSQPACQFSETTGTTDCGNWAISAEWDVPLTAVSGIYIAKLTRMDTTGSSHIVFIVRDDASTSELLFKTSDATWQAYNVYGGSSLYVSDVSDLNHASKVSYNRPFSTRSGGGGGGSSEDWLFNAEYPMVRWLERNGYDVTYTTDVDADRRGDLISNHAVFLSVGHDEYWSAQERAFVTAARDAGTHLAFFSGNEVYWKTRWEASGSDGTDYRTLVCYKEGTLGENVCNAKCDPLEGVWTGLWRDGCPPDYLSNDGCAPENSLSGQISWEGSTSSIRVPGAFRDLRFWRNTSIASLNLGQEAVLASETLGYEWDPQQSAYELFYPARRILVSQTDFNGKRHALTLYKHENGALVFGAGTVQWSWGLDLNHDRGSDPVSVDMQQATVNLFADMGVQPESLQADIVATTGSMDFTAPTSLITFPADGSRVQNGENIVVTGTASDLGGVVAGVEVSFDGGETWLLASGTNSWSYASWTPGLIGNTTISSRSYDDSWNLETNWTVITVDVLSRICPCTVFGPSAVPDVIDEEDPNPVELGVKFRTTVDGEISAIRFYKSFANTGTHVGNLWSLSGEKLATTTFSDESESGWQEAPLTPPVAIVADSTYIASYHTTAGHYSVNVEAFGTGIDGTPIRILADNEDGPNGVYAYSSSSTFPSNGYQASNYWVDIVFNYNSGTDVTPPTVVSTFPTSGASGVAVDSSISAIFSEALNESTVDGTSFKLVDSSGSLVTATVGYSSASRTAILAPAALMEYSATYTVTLSGGETDPTVRDVSGNALVADVSWSFTTTSPPSPPPTDGPDGPVLVISAAYNPFSRYTVEILRAEGLNCFLAEDISTVNSDLLDNYQVVILGEMSLTAEQVTMLSDWTIAGGTLIALRPDALLSELLGLVRDGGTMSNKYLKVNSDSGPGVGIVSETIQYHGTADLYSLNGATAVATLYSDASTSTTNPAVSLNDVGSGGGQAVAFTYDLARSVVYTRQGNPEWAGQKRDGQIDPVRSDDLFFPDWIDLNKVSIPQADEQQRLLVNLIILGNLDKNPLPRFWYLPSGHKAAVVMTGDNHGDGGMEPRFDKYINESAMDCSVEDWECIRATGYMYIGNSFTETEAQDYHDLGFEVAMHVDSGCSNYTRAEFQNFIDSAFNAFATKYPALPLQTTNRNHCVAWAGWSVTAEVEAANGIRLDTNYYYWPPGWVNDRSGMFTGSGIPMRFAKLDGTIIDCFQATTQIPDESGLSFPSFCDQLLDRALGIEGYYGVFTTNMHFDQTDHAGSNAIVESAKARGVPVVSSKQMLDWLDGRSGSSFQNIIWDGSVLSFGVTVAVGARNLFAMLPTMVPAGLLNGITENETPITYTSETIKGIEYAFFRANAATYAATYAADITPPMITNLLVTPHNDGTATITWTTNENSDSHIDYGTIQGTLSFSASDPALVTSHALLLTDLSASTSFFLRVTSTDPAGNSMTSPNPPTSPLEFTMPAPTCFLDNTTADFVAGTNVNTSVVAIGGGDIILKPAASAEFGELPSIEEWDGRAWNTDGTWIISDGNLVVDGARFNTEPESKTYLPGTSIEFVAIFGTTERLQHVGFGGGDDIDMFNILPFALFSTGTGGTLITRTGVSSVTDFTIPGPSGETWLNVPHRFRIDWTQTGFDYYIDDNLVHTHSTTISAPMRPGISDFDVAGQALQVDWIHVSPYAAAGSFTSRVYDAGGPADWDMVTWNANLPLGTDLQMSVRFGTSLVPDASWTQFVPVLSSGHSGSFRYVQYRADLFTDKDTTTPVLQSVSIACTAGNDTSPPVITNISAAPRSDGTAMITWMTNEFSDSRVDYGTEPDNLILSAVSNMLTALHNVELTGLMLGTRYYFRVSSTDVATNTATEPLPARNPLSFVISVQCPADVTAEDFYGGIVDAGSTVVLEADGEIVLSPEMGADFTGDTLPPEWNSGEWATGGSAMVENGMLTVDGARAYTIGTYAPTRSIEFVATYAVGTFMNIGFASDNQFNAPWIAIGEGSNADAVFARSNTNEAGLNLGGADLRGSPHRYRIDWKESSFDFHVDGELVQTINQIVTTNMTVIISDFNPGGAKLSVDWLRITPYSASGSFISRVFDMGVPTNWGAATWSGDIPPGTSLSLLVRTGNNANFSGIEFSPVSDVEAVGGTSRFIQYRADLNTTLSGSTPVLRDVTVECTPSSSGTESPSAFSTSSSPSASPSISHSPSTSPSTYPSRSHSPSDSPSASPRVSNSPSSSPSALPSVSHSPTASPSSLPSVSHSPSADPTASPSVSHSPSASPSASATVSRSPSASPSTSPSISHFPSGSPSTFPSLSHSPSGSPSSSPSISHSPSTIPTSSPGISYFPSASPSASPSVSHFPSASPSASPSVSHSPSSSPTASPSVSHSPSASPSASPTVSRSPNASPSTSPSISHFPSGSPSTFPSVSHSPSGSPSSSPSIGHSPSTIPTSSPSISYFPSASPSASPSVSYSPSASPSASPSVSLSPSANPSSSPSVIQNDFPSISRTLSSSPSGSPSLREYPSSSPSDMPTSLPTRKNCLESKNKCAQSSDCCSNICLRRRCSVCQKEKKKCTENAHCCSNICLRGRCSDTIQDLPCLEKKKKCSENSDCCSNICSRGRCST